jgi:sigma-B regulation protein RsbU (phosphoserine phosphatase)
VANSQILCDVPTSYFKDQSDGRRRRILLHDCSRGIAPPIFYRVKILIADDEAVALSILEVTLEQMGYEVVVTHTGTEAWDAFDRDPARIVVSDWKMPGMDGLEFCRRIRARPQTPYTYFILLTALNTSSENYDLATKASVDDFLTKPLHRSGLQMRLRVADRILWFTKEVHQLQQLIPICCSCLKINTGEEFWQQFETYIEQHTASRFSHGFCPQCMEAEMAKVGAGSVL